MVGVEFEVARFEVVWAGWVVSWLGWVEVELGLGQVGVGGLRPARVA